MVQDDFINRRWGKLRKKLINESGYRWKNFDSIDGFGFSYEASRFVKAITFCMIPDRIATPEDFNNAINIVRTTLRV